MRSYQSWPHSALAEAGPTMPDVKPSRDRDTTGSHVRPGERPAPDQRLGLQAALGGEQADAVRVAVHDGLMIERAVSSGKIAGGEHAQLVAIRALEHRAEFRAGMLMARGQPALGDREQINPVLRRVRGV